MIWVVNGNGFRSNFHILHRLPDPSADFVRDLVFLPRKHNDQGEIFYRKSENPDASRSFWIHDLHEIQEEVNRSYVGHHVFDWVRPRSVWFEAKAPVYFDFNADNLWKLAMDYQTGLPCVQSVSRQSFFTYTVSWTSGASAS
jgi:hypothetical protein